MIQYKQKINKEIWIFKKRKERTMEQTIGAWWAVWAFWIAGILLVATVFLYCITKTRIVFIPLMGTILFLLVSTIGMERHPEDGYELTYYPTENTATIRITTQKPEEYVWALKNGLKKIQKQQEGVVAFITTEIKVLVKPKSPVPQEDS